MAVVKLGLREFKAMDKQFHCKDFLSKKERAFIEARKVDESTSIQFSWRYECCAVMLWALGFMELNDFDSICDVAGMATIIRSFDSIEDMCKAANRRSDDELLDMHTRVLYYDWACVDARIHQKEWKALIQVLYKNIIMHSTGYVVQIIQMTGIRYSQNT